MLPEDRVYKKAAEGDAWNNTKELILSIEKGSCNRGFVQDLSLCSPEKEKYQAKCIDESTETDLTNNHDTRQHNEVIAPDGRWGWVVCFACFIECLLYDGVFYTFGIVFLDLTDSFNSDKGTGAWITSMGFGVCLIMGPTVSVMINRMGYRTVAIIGSFTACLGLVMSSFATSIQFIYFSYGVVLGLGYSLVYQPSIIAVTMYFDKRRSLATGLSLCGNGLGVFIMSPITEWLLQNYSWRGCFLIQGAMLLNGILCALVYLPLTSRHGSKQHRQQESGIEKSVPNCKGISKEGINDMTILHQPPWDDEKKQVPYILPATKFTSTNISYTDRIYNGLPTIDCNIGKQEKHVPSINIDTMGNERRHVCHLRSLDDEKNQCVFPETRVPTPSLSCCEIGKHTIIRSVNIVSCKDIVSKEFNKNILAVIILTFRKVGKVFFSTVLELFDFSLLKQLPFCLFVISSTLFQFSYYIPFVYLPDLANLAGITAFQAAWLLSSIGVSNIVSRALFGIVSDRPYVNRLIVYSGCVFGTGIVIILKPFAGYFTVLLGLAIVFGLLQGLSTLLISVVIADLVGPSRMATGLGIRNLFAGFATFVGPPFAGWMFDMTDNYDLPFYFFGAVTSLSGAMLFVIPCLNKTSSKQKDAKLDVIDREKEC